MIFNFIKAFLADRAKNNPNFLEIGKRLWVFFPNKGKYYKMEVSGITCSRFSARFVNKKDWEDSNVENYYNQVENDIKIDRETFTPVTLD